MLICVTDRNSCKDDFLMRINDIAKCSPFAVILREKDMNAYKYKELAEQCFKICSKYNTILYVSHNIEAAKKIGCKNLHLSYELYMQKKLELQYFERISVSVHSTEEAEKLNTEHISHIITGHIFATDCKKGIPARGLMFLKDICEASVHPVYAIGGISPQNKDEVLSCGAAGFCVMSGAMNSNDIKEYIKLITSNN